MERLPSFETFESSLKLQNNLAKYKIVGFKRKVHELIGWDSKKKKGSCEISFERKRKRPDLDEIKQETGDFDIYDFKSPLGFLSGCNSFSFRITFKEYKGGLKAAKFSLLLNQFNLNLEKFIELIEDVLVNNFPLSFYEEFFKEEINEIDFKIHFLVVLNVKGKNTTTTKFLIFPKGCFFFQMRELLWPTLFLEPLFLYSILNYYIGFKRHLGLIFVLILFYLYKLLHFKLVLLVNKHKIYDIDERSYESFGNILSLKYVSYKLYCKKPFKVPRYSYLIRRRSINHFMQDAFEENLQSTELKTFREKNWNLSSFFDLLTLDEHLLDRIPEPISEN